MKLKKGQISRRGFLAGSGATLMLPMLESVVPSTGFAQTLPAPRLLIVTYSGGIDDNRIYPDGTPHLSALAANKFCSHYQPLTGLAGSFSVIGNLHNTTGSYPCDFVGGAHGGAAASLFTCGMVYSKESNGNLPLAGPSFDQVVGQSLYANRGTMATFVIGTPDGNDNVESWGFPYNRYTSYRQAGGKIEAAPLILNPKEAFNQVVNATAPPVTQPPASGPNPIKTLVDYVLADAKALRRKISKNDQLTLDRYLANVTDLQKSISTTQPPPTESTLTCNGTAPNVPSGLGWDQHPTTIDQMNEIVKLAFQCDRTRVINYAMGQCQSVINFSRFGLKNADGSSVMDRDHHNITHTNENPDEYGVKVKSLETIVKWYNQKFANLLNMLKNTNDPVYGGSLLDNTIVIWTSEHSQGWNHYSNHLPIILAGGGAGLLKNQGKYMAFTDKVLSFTCSPEHGQTYNMSGIYPQGDAAWRGHNVSDLYLTLMQRMGVMVNGSTITKFGDSTGTIAI